MPARLKTADPAAVDAALERMLGTETPEPADLRLLVKHFLAVLADRAPGRSVEVRVPPYAATQAIPGPRHTRGTPPGVIEMAPLTWILLATGRLEWATAVDDARVVASGERTDLAAHLPLV